MTSGAGAGSRTGDCRGQMTRTRGEQHRNGSGRSGAGPTHPRSRRMRWTVEVSGWRYTRRWVIGVRRGEWWIGARFDFLCDWWEINVLGVTAFIPADRVPLRQGADHGR